MIDSHTHYDYLCALAAAGQLSPDDREALHEHLKDCPDCRRALLELQEVSIALTELSSTHSSSPLPEGMYARFRARALTEGILVAPDPSPREFGSPRRWSSWMRIGAWAAAAVVITVAIVLVMRRPTVSGPIVQQTKSSIPASPHPPNGGENIATGQLSVQDQLHRLQEEQRVVEAELKDQQQALKAALVEKAALNARIATLKTENDEVHGSESQAKAELERLEHELETARSGETAARNAYGLRAVELAELRDQVARLNTELDREHRLSAALEEAQDLIQSRNVHVITLGGVNEQGKRERPFGRAFYIVGQKLVLFAFDLSDPRTLNAHSFYLWGDKPGTNEPVHSLGRLKLEDRKDDRWAIRVEDPDLFARINEVFITIESSKNNVNKPTGKQMLAFSLTTNHP